MANLTSAAGQLSGTVTYDDNSHDSFSSVLAWNSKLDRTWSNNLFESEESMGQIEESLNLAFKTDYENTLLSLPFVDNISWAQSKHSSDVKSVTDLIIHYSLTLTCDDRTTTVYSITYKGGETRIHKNGNPCAVASQVTPQFEKLIKHITSETATTEEPAPDLPDPILYGIGFSGEFFTLADDVLTEISEDIGFDNPAALAVDPTTGQMYGATNGDGTPTAAIWTIDHVGLSSELVGSTGLFTIWGMAFDSSGQMFITAATSDGGDIGFYSVDKATGVPTEISDSINSTTFSGAIEFIGDTLYYVTVGEGAGLFTIDKSDGTVSFVGASSDASLDLANVLGVLRGTAFGEGTTLGTYDTSNGDFTAGPLTGANLVGITYV